jgi:DNA ligase 1
MTPATLVTIKSSDVLQSKQKNGLRKFWQGHIVHFADDPTIYYTQTSYWSELKGGELSTVQYSEPYKAEPRNIGKANETTSLSQAELEFASMIQTIRDKKKYRREDEDMSNDRPGPMLAHNYDDQKKKLVYPLFVQPKYDGNRMMYSNGIGWSRGDKTYIPEVLAHLHFDTKGWVFDGEMILPGNVPLQRTASAVKRFQPGISDTLLFIIFDVFIPEEPNLTFEERLVKLADFFFVNDLPTNVQKAPTIYVGDEQDLNKAFSKWVAEGFEGLIARNVHGKYDVGNRSYDLQKYKPFIDEEFPVITVIPMGEGKARNLGKLVLKAKNGETFEAIMLGTDEERTELLENKLAYIGKFVTTRYQALTERGVPQFPRGIAFRDEGTF